jgi:hypothetical protein
MLSVNINMHIKKCFEKCGSDINFFVNINMHIKKSVSLQECYIAGFVKKVGASVVILTWLCDIMKIQICFNINSVGDFL